MSVFNYSAENRFYFVVKKIIEERNPNVKIISLDESLLCSVNCNKLSLGCFLTDIIELEKIVKSSNIVDFFIVTSEIQAKILKSCLNVRCFSIFEPLDPLYFDFFKLNFDFKIKNEIILFGYSNSLERTLSPFLSDIVCLANSYKIRVFSEKLPPFLNSVNLEFNKFDKIYILNDGFFRFSLISDVAADLSMATFCKSTNKFYSSLGMNFIPLVLNFFGKYDFLTKLSYPFVGDRAIFLKLNFVHNFDFIAFRTQILENYNNDVYVQFDFVCKEVEIISSHKDFIKPIKISKWPGKKYYSISIQFKELVNAIKASIDNIFVF